MTDIEIKFFWNQILEKDSYMKARCPAYSLYLSFRNALEDTLSAWSATMAEHLRDYRASDVLCSLRRASASYQRGLELYATPVFDVCEMLEKGRLGAQYTHAQEAMFECYETLYYTAVMDDSADSAKQFVTWLGEVDSAIADLMGRFFCMFGYNSAASVGENFDPDYTRLLEGCLFPNRDTQ